MNKQLTKTYLKINAITKSYNDREVLNSIDLEIKEGEFVAVIGKSGCGKSTLLRLIAGLEAGNSGNIVVGNKPLKGLNSDARIMFQDGRLLPWKRVIDNVAIGLKGKCLDKALESLRNVGLEERAGDWPATLSGGQKQRVALARGLANDPHLLLLDEPLGALDALTRIEMQELIENIWRQKQLTAILVTHDVEEAVALADRIVLIEEGRVVLDEAINLSRPRQRSHPAFINYVEDILDKLINRQSTVDLRLMEKNKCIVLR